MTNQNNQQKNQKDMTRVGFEPTPLTRPGNLKSSYCDKVTLPWRLGPLGHLAGDNDSLPLLIC